MQKTFHRTFTFTPPLFVLYLLIQRNKVIALRTAELTWHEILRDCWILCHTRHRHQHSVDLRSFVLCSSETIANLHIWESDASLQVNLLYSASSVGALICAYEMKFVFLVVSGLAENVLCFFFLQVTSFKVPQIIVEFLEFSLLFQFLFRFASLEIF